MSYREYFSLSAVSAVLIVINLAEVFNVHHINAIKKLYAQYMVLCVPSAAIIIVWIYVMLDWSYDNFKNQFISAWNNTNATLKTEYSELLIFSSRVS